MRDIDTHPFGHGLGTAGRVQRERGRFSAVATFAIDNAYLQMAYEQGLLVMLLFVASCLVLLAGLVRRGLLTASREKAGVAIGAAGAMAAYLVLLVAGSYTEELGNLAFWIIMGLGISQFTAAAARGDGV